MNEVFLFVDLEFPRGRRDQVEKSWKFQGVGGSNVKPSGMENPGGWGLKRDKTLRWGGGVWIFSGTTHFKKVVYNALTDWDLFKAGSHR